MRFMSSSFVSSRRVRLTGGASAPSLEFARRGLPWRCGSRLSSSKRWPTAASPPSAPARCGNGPRAGAGYAEMTNLPRALREELDETVPFSSLSLEDEAHSRDGTVKALFRTGDGHPVEAVLMRYRDGRRSICVSSQSGCPLTCTFCATGAMRFGRNLRASRDPRPGAALPPDRAGEPSRLHGDGRAVPQRRRGARGGTAPAPDRDHAPANDDLDRGLAAGSDAVRRRGRAADPARAVDPRSRSDDCARI